MVSVCLSEETLTDTLTWSFPTCRSRLLWSLFFALLCPLPLDLREEIFLAGEDEDLLAGEPALDTDDRSDLGLLAAVSELLFGREEEAVFSIVLEARLRLDCELDGSSVSLALRFADAMRSFLIQVDIND